MCGSRQTLVRICWRALSVKIAWHRGCGGSALGAANLPQGPPRCMRRSAWGARRRVWLPDPRGSAAAILDVALAEALSTESVKGGKLVRRSQTQTALFPRRSRHPLGSIARASAGPSGRCYVRDGTWKLFRVWPCCSLRRTLGPSRRATSQLSDWPGAELESLPPNSASGRGAMWTWPENSRHVGAR
jgi:hypothetical protein